MNLWIAESSHLKAAICQRASKQAVLVCVSEHVGQISNFMAHQEPYKHLFIYLTTF